MSGPQQALLAIAAAAAAGGAGTATWSPTDKTAGWSLSGGNLVATETTTNDESIRATQGASNGELVYFEILIGTATSGSLAVGLRESANALTTGLGPSSHLVALRSSGTVFATGGCAQNSTQTITFTSGDVIGFAVNRSTQFVWAYLNGTIFSGDPVAGTGPQFTLTSGGVFMPMAQADNNGTNNSVTLRVLSTAWGYSAPTGYGQLP